MTLNTKNLGMAYREGDHFIYRASAVGVCPTALVAAMMGMEEQRYERTQTILDNAAGQGNLLEDHVLERLAEMGYRITARQLSMELEVLPDVVIRGHVDGVAGGGPNLREPAGVEVKTMSKDRFAKWMGSGGDLSDDGDFGRYGWQESVYWEGLRRDHGIGQYVYAVIDRNSGQLDVRVFEEPVVPWRQIRRKIIDVQRWVGRDELPPCETTNSGEKFFCAYPMLHDMGEDDDVGVVDDLTAAVVGGLAERYEELSVKVRIGRDAEGERKEIGQQLMRHVPRGASMKVGKYRVTGTGGSSPYADWRAIAEDMGLGLDEAKQRYEKRREYEYPRVTKEST